MTQSAHARRGMSGSWSHRQHLDPAGAHKGELDSGFLAAP